MARKTIGTENTDTVEFRTQWIKMTIVYAHRETVIKLH